MFSALLFFSMEKALLVLLLYPLTATVNYILEFRGMRPLCQCIKRFLSYFRVWCLDLKSSSSQFMDICDRSADLAWCISD